MTAAPTPRELEERMTETVRQKLVNVCPGNPTPLSEEIAAAALAVVREALAEASEEMQIAAASERHYRHSDGLSYDDAEIAWRSMLAASPLRAGS